MAMISRREFFGKSALGLIALSGAGGVKSMAWGSVSKEDQVNDKKAVISLVKTGDRKSGVRRAIELLRINPVKGKKVMIKPNFNSADPAPGSTHNDTLEEIIKSLQDMEASSITIGERSGFAGFLNTGKIMAQKGIPELAKRFGVEVINFDTLKKGEWKRIQPKGSHWIRGFDVPRPLLESEAVVSTCCLKTHRVGGHFSISLKNSVGIVKTSFMSELHSSLLSMRKMIAEINTAYSPCLIVLDGVDVFTDGGPETGELKKGNVVLAGNDRVAIDAAGIAILKELGSNKRIMSMKIFEHDQIARAVELGLGVPSPDRIEIVTGDEESKSYAEKIKSILLQG